MYNKGSPGLSLREFDEIILLFFSSKEQDPGSYSEKDFSTTGNNFRGIGAQDCLFSGILAPEDLRMPQKRLGESGTKVPAGQLLGKIGRLPSRLK